MAPHTSMPMANLDLDEQALSAFVAEIAESLDNTALAFICDNRQRIIWHQEFQNGAPAPEECQPQQKTPLREPAKRPLGRGNFAYDFPLTCSNVNNLVFSVVIYTLDPPSLTSVNMRINEMLKCLVRQIDVDSTLSTTAIVARDLRMAAAPSDSLQNISISTVDSSSLQSIVDLCFEQHDLECVSIVLPANRIRVVACQPSFDRMSVKDLAIRLHDPVNRKRTVVTAQITLPSGDERRVVCAPILRRQKSIDGLVFLVSRDVEPVYSRVVRLIANKIASVVHAQPSKTTLLNRVELVSQLDATLGGQPTLPHSIIYFDADKMHTINDAFGYSGGDGALAVFQRILLDSAGANDSVAHLGSDRFAMMLPGASGDTAVSKADQVLRFLSQESIEDKNKSINLSASAGVVDNSAATKGAEDMLILAEVASRGAQDRGGNQCALFQDIDSSIIQRRSDVDKVGFLQMALLENRFVLHAQSIEAINAESNRKFELLARLDDENHPDSSPAQFLSAAERYQLMAALDRWVINSALTSIAAADNTLDVGLTTFCINVSAQSLQDDTFIDFIEARIAETGVPPDTLCFELTETSLVRYIDRAQRFVHRLQRLGCQVALDDFGTGYSSFAYLKTLPVNFLKIDGSFVRDLLENELSKTIVKSVVDIATVIGAQTVAEHVENPMVQAWLKESGVHFVQGFAVHRPEPFADVLAGMDGLSGVLENHSDCIDLRTTPLRAMGDS